MKERAPRCAKKKECLRVAASEAAERAAARRRRRATQLQDISEPSTNFPGGTLIHAVWLPPGIMLADSTGWAPSVTRLQRLAALSWQAAGARVVVTTCEQCMLCAQVRLMHASLVSSIQGQLSPRQLAQLELHLSHAAGLLYGGLWLSLNTVLMPPRLYRDPRGVSRPGLDDLPEFFVVPSCPWLSHRLPRVCHLRLAAATRLWASMSAQDFEVAYAAAVEGVLVDFPEVCRLEPTSRVRGVRLAVSAAGVQQVSGAAAADGYFLWVKPRALWAASDRDWWDGTSRFVLPSPRSLLSSLWLHYTTDHECFLYEPDDNAAADLYSDQCDDEGFDDEVFAT